MSQSAKELLSDAIARNSGIVLSLPSAGMLRHHKSRFLADHENGFWVESAKGESLLITELLHSKQPAGISFRQGHQKVVFASPLLRVDPEFRLNDGMKVEALLVATPAEIKAIQRRSNYRVGVYEGAGVTARVWRIAEHTYLGDRPKAAQELALELRDISTGGVGVIFRPKNGEPPKVIPEDRLRIEITHGQIVFLLEGRSRAGVGDADGIRTGIAFKSLDKDLEGRQKLAMLTRIVGELQREEVRRVRRGLCSVPADDGSSEALAAPAPLATSTP